MNFLPDNNRGTNNHNTRTNVKGSIQLIPLKDFYCLLRFLLSLLLNIYHIYFIISTSITFLLFFPLIIEFPRLRSVTVIDHAFCLLSSHKYVHLVDRAITSAFINREGVGVRNTLFITYYTKLINIFLTIFPTYLFINFSIV